MFNKKFLIPAVCLLLVVAISVTLSLNDIGPTYLTDPLLVISLISCIVFLLYALARGSLKSAKGVSGSVSAGSSRGIARLLGRSSAIKPLLRNPAFLIVLTAVVGLGAFSAGLTIWGNWNDEWGGYNRSTRIGDGQCNIAVIPVSGDIGIFGKQYKSENDVADADDIVTKIHQAEGEPGIFGIMVRIDSSGGAPVASRLIMDAMKRSTIPVVAVIRENGTSGAYMVASGAEFIFADPMSDVGDIGITMSYLDNTAKNKREGLTFVPLASAKYKDYGNPNKPLTAEERALMQRDLRIYHDEFVSIVAKNRKIPVDVVAKLADGSSLPGALALEHKLIDALGDQESARDWISRRLMMPLKEVSYCE